LVDDRSYTRQENLKMVRRANILILMADQMAASFLPFNAPSPVLVPTLTRLAHEGVLFRSAYCNSPLCAPSRFSMMAGQLPSRIGAYDTRCTGSRNG
jgi:choline-sulfatase